VGTVIIKRYSIFKIKELFAGVGWGDALTPDRHSQNGPPSWSLPYTEEEHVCAGERTREHPGKLEEWAFHSYIIGKSKIE